MGKLDLSNLNKQQYKAATSYKGPSLVLAGAGTGKTTTVAHRVAYLVKEKGVNPKNILLLTFTNKAAQEFTKRVNDLLGGSDLGIISGTFHFLGNLMLRKYATSVGYEKNYSILDPSESMDALSVISPKNYKRRDIKQLYDKFKHAELWHIPLSSLADNWIGKKKLEKLYKGYTTYKKEHGYVDFEDLLYLPIKMMENKEISDRLNKKFKFILVDEYQDTCKTQVLFLKQFTKKTCNIMAVGDPAQSIYMFRGARYQNIIDFPKDFKGAKIFKLEDNYRSTNQILALANGLSISTSDDYKKCLRSKAKMREGKNPELLSYLTRDDHAEDVAKKISKLIYDGHDPEGIAVIYRSNFTANLLEIKLKAFNIEYIKHGGMSLFDRIHIRDFLALISAFYSKKNELSWIRVLSFCPGIGSATASKIHAEYLKFNDFEKYRGKHFYDNLALIGDTRNSFKASKKDKLRKRLNICFKLYRMILKSTFKGQEVEGKILDIQAFIESVTKLGYGTVGSMLKLLKLDKKTKESKNRVILTTVHSAKGLEFETVFVHGVASNNFPHSKINQNSVEELDEERRILYVAVTRAKKMLYLTMCSVRDQNELNYHDDDEEGQKSKSLLPTDVSPFISELPGIGDLIKVVAVERTNYRFTT